MTISPVSPHVVAPPAPDGADKEHDGDGDDGASAAAPTGAVAAGGHIPPNATMSVYA